VRRAKAEAAEINLNLEFRVDDMRKLQTFPLGDFGGSA
jgi:hypothetical protein